jgi:hypothetical protein
MAPRDYLLIRTAAEDTCALVRVHGSLTVDGVRPLVQAMLDALARAPEHTVFVDLGTAAHVDYGARELLNAVLPHIAKCATGRGGRVFVHGLWRSGSRDGTP